jgi:hypothetical protein
VEKSPDDTQPLTVGTPAAIASANQAPIARTLVGDTGYFDFSAPNDVLLLTPASHHLLAYARTLVAEYPQFAVLFAHAACELHTEGELIRLVNARTDKVLGRLVLPGERDIKSLANSRIYGVYSALTDDFPAGSKDRQPAQWWEAWWSSRDDRHKVAHRGAQMSQGQAEAAIAVADAYIKHLTEKVDAALERARAQQQNP